MTVQTGLVELLTLHSPSTPDAKELIEALGDFAKSRATRELIRSNVQRRFNVRFAYRCSRTVTRSGRPNSGVCCAR